MEQIEASFISQLNDAVGALSNEIAEVLNADAFKLCEKQSLVEKPHRLLCLLSHCQRVKFSAHQGNKPIQL